MVYSGYCTIAQIKPRLLISDATYDTELETAGTEASRMIDDKLRPFLTVRQKLTLLEAGYISCQKGDVGRQVEDDGVQVGMLLRYNNTTRIWHVITTATIADASEITITGGKGEGTASGASADDVTETETPTFIFKTLPLSGLIPEIIKEICADLAAGLFKRRHKPESFDQGWFNQGLTKLKEFIEANFKAGKILL